MQPRQTFYPARAKSPQSEGNAQNLFSTTAAVDCTRTPPLDVLVPQSSSPSGSRQTSTPPLYYLHYPSIYFTSFKPIIVIIAIYLRLCTAIIVLYYWIDMRQVTRLFTTLQHKPRFHKVETKVEDKIGYIYLNSPSDFNALSLDMRANLSAAFRAHQASNDVKVILLLSKVAKAFCAGANIKQFQGRSAKDFENNDIFQEIHDSIYSAKKPILSGVNGVALGGGCELALLTDVVFCSEEARFALPQLKLGLIPGIGGTQRFARIAGRVNANRYVFTSEFISAKRAYQMGLVSEVFPTADLHSKVIELAKQITNKPLPALLAAKAAIKENENLTMNGGVALERKLFYPLYDTKGMEEGVKAFVEKRKPNHRDL